MEKQVHLLSGRLQGMEISRHEILDVTEAFNEHTRHISFQQDELSRRLIEHERILREALKICTAGLAEAEKHSVNRVRLAKTMDEAKQVIAIMGEVIGEIPMSIQIDEMVAQGQSRQVGVTNHTEFALEFLK
jgi:hypothetical protein